MRLQISHTTTYRFDSPATHGLQQLRLTPKSFAGQRVVSWTLSIQGGRVETEFTDQHGNLVSLISYDADVSEISVMCLGEVETSSETGVVGKHRGPVPLWLYQRSTELTRAGPNVRRLAKGLKEEFDGELPMLHGLSARILEAVPYELGRTAPSTTADAAIEAGRGVCQDHAHIFVAAARALDIPARYVSGYLLMEGQSQQDATHAWAEAHVPGLGWVGFDVSNAISPDPRYVRVATGLDYAEAAPISGLRYGAGAEALQVAIQVQQQ